jgi:TFIIF-interacting CTD phosphatase-like protein
LVKAYVKKRPGVAEFLEECSKNFEIVVFTASRSYYASLILDELDKNRNLISKRLYREHCSTTDGVKFVKVKKRNSKKGPCCTWKTS